MDGFGGATTFAPGDPFFDSLSALEQIGYSSPAVPVGAGVAQDFPGLARSVGPGGSAAVSAPPWSPHSALFWFGVLLATTTGLAAFSTSFKVRAGKQRAGVSLDVGKA